MPGLNSIWKNLLSSFTTDNEFISELWTEIEYAYTSKNRCYHNLSHIEYMITHSLNVKKLVDDLDIILFSVFYHDIIYHIKSNSNEEKSADLAAMRLAKLGVQQSRIDKCHAQILSTKGHSFSNDNDTNFLIDFDLAILGESQEKYQTYVTKIRQEYSLYPDFLYKKGRKKVIKHFLEMRRIFKTDFFHNQCEIQAKNNLEEELRALDQ